MAEAEIKNPWDYLHDHDIERFGERILNPEERSDWCSAILTGGLPYMWQEAAHLRTMVYDRLELNRSDKVLLIGESNESCGFDQDIQNRIGEEGQLRSIDIIEQARDMCIRGQRGANDKLGTWEYTYTHEDPDACFDSIVLMQGVQHCEDWNVGSDELLRVLKPGGMIVLAEIAHGPYLIDVAGIDVHLEYYIRKLYMGTNMLPEDFSYWSLPEIEASFADKVVDTGQHAERGFEIFWGRKPI